MKLFSVENKKKSDHINKKLMKVVLRQKPFLGLIQSETNAEILTLHTMAGELDSCWMMIIKFT